VPCVRFTPRCGDDAVIRSTRRWPSAAAGWYTARVDASVEVRYAGVVVGRGALVRDLGEEGAFVALPEPLPVGTTVTLKIDDVARSAIVEEVVESAEPSAAGMRVRWGAAVPMAREQSTTASSSPPPAGPAAATAIEGSGVVVEALGEDGATGATPSVATDDDVSEAIRAPLSLAGAGGQPSHGGGKKRRKRR
jgi:hypothetical protein